MGLDYGAILRGAAPTVYDPAEDDARALQQQEGKLRLSSLMQQMQAQQQESQRQGTLREAIAAARRPDGSIDQGAIGNAFLSVGDLAGYNQHQTSQAQMAKAQREQKLGELDYHVKAYDAVDRALAGIGALPPEQRAQAWAAERRRLGGLLDEETLSELPDAVDDATIQRFRLHAMDGKERAAAEQQQWLRGHQERQFGETQRHNRTQENLTAQGQKITLRGQDMSRGNALIAADTARQKPPSLTDQINLAKWQEAQREKQQGRAGAVASMDTAIGTLNRLTAHPGMSTAVGAKGLTGGLMAGWVPSGTDAAGFLAELEAFKSQMFLPMVQQLKGMGALSNAEGQKLTAAVGALEPSMPEAEFKASASRIMQDIEAAKARAGGVNFSHPNAPAGIARAPKPQGRLGAQDRLKAKYGLE